MAITLPSENEVETTVSYKTVMTAALALIQQADRYVAECMTKEFTVDCLSDIRSALIELEWNTNSVDALIVLVSKRDF